MHIPENYLSPSTSAVMVAAMIPVWKIAARKVKEEITNKKMPLLGIGAAFSFLIMMFNIPLPGGTTGHAVGGTLVAILLGPYAASISISIVLLIQALFFGDGGILAFGANAFNVAFVLPFTGYYIYKFIKGRIKTQKGEHIAIFIGSYIALNLAAFITAIEFGLQPVLFRDSLGMPLYAPYPISISVPAMMIPHLLVAGVLEGIITVGVYRYIKKVSPEITYEGSQIKKRPAYLLIGAMILLSPLGLLATGTAWGEWSIEEIKEVVIGGKALGFTPKGMEEGFSLNSIMPGYTISGVNEVIAYILSAAIGTAMIIIAFKVLLNRKARV